MEFIKSWILCVCTTLILAVIFSVLTPKGSLGKFYKAIISVFIFISFLYPVTNAHSADFKIDLPAFNDSYNSNLQQAYSTNIESIISAQLKNSGINADVSADVKINDNDIEINKVMVYIPDNYEKEAVKQLLLEEIGLVVEVKYIGE